MTKKIKNPNKRNKDEQRANPNLRHDGFKKHGTAKDRLRQRNRKRAAAKREQPVEETSDTSGH